MKIAPLLVLCALLTTVANVSLADDDDDLKAIRANAKAFIEAFNASDAKAIAGLWTEDADYRDVRGRFFHGRDAVERNYAEFFDENSGKELKLELSVESLRKVTPDVAIEDGISTVSQALSGPPVGSRYTAVHVLRDGTWLIASAREWQFEVDSHYAHLQPLEWLIGTWVGEAPGRKSETTFEWTKNKNFIKRTFTIRKGDDDFTITTGQQVIGYDRANGTIRSWLFDSNGGFAESVWSETDNGLAGSSTSVLPSGSVAHSIDVLRRLSDSHFTFQSIHRKIDGAIVPDGEAIELRRKEPTPVASAQRN